MIEVTDTGVIAGNVRWQGDVPELETFEARTHRDECGASQPSRALRVSDSGGVADVVVSIDARSGAALEAPSEPVVIDNVGCRFEPHVSAVGVGWTLVLRNSDSVLHNVHGYADDDSVIDVGLPERGSDARRQLDEPGVVRLVDDAGHTWQQAWIHAFEHPYYAVSGDDGRFRIEDVPPGQYTLRLWHEGWRVVGTQAGRPRYSNPVVLSRSVTVTTEQETVVDFELSSESAEIAGD